MVLLRKWMWYNDAMKMIELLSPVGKEESVYAAIQNGADAIYMSGVKFGARAFADNFSISEIEEVVTYAHTYNVKVYITLNTLVYEDELMECKQYIKQLYDCCVDALIVQDLGILYYIRKTYPDFEIHASTQMHIYNRDALLFLHEQGVKRAVLARECTLKQIMSFQDIPIEKEVFVHGALCISFSGQCLFSAMNNERSGNRGACAQGCRMPYILWKKNSIVHKKAYLLSPKDLNVLDEISQFKQIGIDSIKLEGRMKSSEYVAYTTMLYRRALDYNDFKITPEEMTKWKVLFHRDYTKGHLFEDYKLMNHDRPNHIGIPIGKVISTTAKQMRIKLTATLQQHDGVRLLMNPEEGFLVNRIYKDGLLVNRALANDIIELDTKGKKIPKNTLLVKTKDIEIEKEIQKTYQGNKRKIFLQAEVFAEPNKKLRLIIKDMNENQIQVVSKSYMEEAQKRATTKEDIEKQLQKTGDTIYHFEKIDTVVKGEVFIPLRILNELRREVLEKYQSITLTNFKRIETPFMIHEVREQTITTTQLEVSVHTEEQLVACMKYENVHIFVGNKKLFMKYHDNKNVHFKQSNVTQIHDEDSKMAGDIGGLDKNYDLDYSLNITNSYAVEYLQRLRNGNIYLSLELKDAHIESLIKEYEERVGGHADIGVLLYGKPRLMSMKYCPINDVLSDGKKKHCNLCKEDAYHLEDVFHHRFLLKGDDACITHMYHHQAVDKIEKLNIYKMLGIKLFRLDFIDETPQQIHQIIQKFQINNQ
ncbi:putative protease [Breznakia sp. PFB2-8]|nr:putative protease [Breznakia sp. PFB2-8]MDF9859536.1 putative protease [Breznakia sp. PH5-24]